MVPPQVGLAAFGTLFACGRKKGQLLGLLKYIEKNKDRKEKGIGRKAAANPQEEREAWRQHFANVSKGQGSVNPRI